MYIKLYLLAICLKNITAWNELVKILELGQLQWYYLVQFLYVGDRKVQTLTVCPVLLWLQEEVETVVSMLIEQARALARTGMKKHLRVLPMYAGLPSPEQLKVFERVPHTVRKVSSCVCLHFHHPEGCLQHTGCIYELHITGLLQMLL